MFGNANVGGFYPEASVNYLLTRLECAGSRPSGSELDCHGNECLHLFVSLVEHKSFTAGRMQCVTDAMTLINRKLVRCPEEYIMTHFCILLDILFGDGQGGGAQKG